MPSNVNNNVPNDKIKQDKEGGREKSYLHSRSIYLGISSRCVIQELGTNPWSLFRKFSSDWIAKIVQAMSYRKNVYRFVYSMGPWRTYRITVITPLCEICLLFLTIHFWRFRFPCIFPNFFTRMCRGDIFIQSILA